ncbi:MAG: RNA polymerase sigma factor [Mangrovibacterium sp.]
MSENQKNEQYQLIWEKFAKGDDRALSSLYFDFFDSLLNFGMKYSSDRFLVEDCIQNLFVGLLKNRHRQNPVQNIRFYLFKGIRNQLAYEKRKNRKLIPANPDETDFRISYSVENQLIAAETDEFQAKFLKMVTENLTSRQKEALFLKFNCGFDYIQIAELMQISVESVRTLIYRTLKSVKDTFGQDIHTNLLFFNLLKLMADDQPGC